MTKIRDIAAATGRVLEVLAAGTHLRDAIKRIDEHYENIVSAAAREVQQHGENYNKFVNAADTAAQVIDSVDVDEVFGDIRELRGRLQDPDQYAPVLSGEAQAHLLAKIVGFNNAVKGFVKQNKNRHETTLTVRAAHELNSVISMTESIPDLSGPPRR